MEREREGRSTRCSLLLSLVPLRCFFYIFYAIDDIDTCFFFLLPRTYAHDSRVYTYSFDLHARHAGNVGKAGMQGGGDDERRGEMSRTKVSGAGPGGRDTRARERTSNGPPAGHRGMTNCFSFHPTSVAFGGGEKDPRRDNVFSARLGRLDANDVVRRSNFPFFSFPFLDRYLVIRRYRRAGIVYIRK